jgi:hypothetical protein
MGGGGAKYSDYGRSEETEDVGTTMQWDNRGNRSPATEALTSCRESTSRAGLQDFGPRP